MKKKEFIERKDPHPHAIICGNNIDVLDGIYDLYHNKVNLIYIDPPYNRGDNFKFYKDAKNHDEWLNTMSETIQKLKDFLTIDGSIWISIDDSEMAYLKVCCDDIFGRKNFVATVVWQKRNTRENRNIFSTNHEYVLVYAKNVDRFKKKRNLLPPTEELIKRYKNPDNDPRGLWQSVTLSVQAGHAVKSQFYTITSPSGKNFDPPQGRCWIYNEGRMKKEIESHNIWFGNEGNSVPRLKKFLSESNIGVVPETLWNDSFSGTTKDAKQELLSLGIYDEEVFDTPKPEKLLYRIIQIATDEGDLIMDSFVGSGTSIAVAHKCNRNYIGIDIDKNIVKYATARLNKVCEGETGGISEISNWSGGGDFVTCNWK